MQKYTQPSIAQKNISLHTLIAQLKKLYFDDITPQFLEKYEAWMLENKRKYATIAMYLRNLRTIYNQAISKGFANAKLYPFGKSKYIIPKSQNVKKALSLAEIEKIFNYQPKTDAEQRARDYWIFSYLCNGMNMTDMALLRYQDIQGDNIIFYRKKTLDTTRHNMKSIVVAVTPEIKEIIARWGNADKNAEQYVFPILQPDLSPKQERAIIKQATKTTNKYVKRIALSLGIDKNVTTYWARHSFSTVLKQSGAPIEFISESLGHHDIRTTENYLDSFESSIKKEYAARLTAFKKPNNE